MRALTSVYSVLVEAWSEFRVYRARVLMAIVGVAVAIMALTSIAAISAVAQQGVVEGLERGQGRPAMMNISLPYSEDGRPLTTDEEFGHLSALRSCPAHAGHPAHERQNFRQHICRVTLQACLHI